MYYVYFAIWTIIMSGLKVAILLSYICVASVTAAIITPALPLIQHDFGLSSGALQWVVSIFLIGYVFGQLIYGPFANRYGRINALKSGFVLHILGLIICLYASYSLNYYLLLAGRLFSALGSAAGLACTFMLINELMTKEQAKKAMSYSVLSFTLGVGIAVTLGGVISEYWRWSGCFALLIIHAVIMLASTSLFKDTMTKPVPLNPSKIINGYIKALKSPKLLIFSLGVSLVTAVSYCFSSSIPLYAHNTLHLSTSEYGGWCLLNTLGMLLSGLISAQLISRKGPEFVLTLGYIFTAPCLFSLISILILKDTNPLWFFTTTMSLFMFTGFIYPSSCYYATNAISDKSSASSMMSFINMGGATLWVIVMGNIGLSPLLAFVLVIGTFYCISLTLIIIYYISRNNKLIAISGKTQAQRAT
jgi:DHA1 family bicyclomycin/chloramphenicol resistance-like MFS transporter